MASKIPRLKKGYIYIKVGSDCKTSRHLKRPKNANFTKTPLKKIEKFVDASTCAFGSQP
jgi:hypothetical protein